MKDHGIWKVIWNFGSAARHGGHLWLLRSSFPASTTASRPFILKQSKPVCILSQFEAIAPDSLCHLSKYRCTLNLPNQSKQHPAPALGILPLITTIKQTQQHSSSSSKTLLYAKLRTSLSHSERRMKREKGFSSAWSPLPVTQRWRLRTWQGHRNSCPPAPSSPRGGRAQLEAITAAPPLHRWLHLICASSLLPEVDG